MRAVFARRVGAAASIQPQCQSSNCGVNAASTTRIACAYFAPVSDLAPVSEATRGPEVLFSS
jgi:hypothetical protein